MNKINFFEESEMERAFYQKHGRKTMLSAIAYVCGDSILRSILRCEYYHPYFGTEVHPELNAGDLCDATY